MPEIAEEIRRKPEVQAELARSTGQKSPKKVRAETRDKLWFSTPVLSFLGCAVFYFLVTPHLVPLKAQQFELGRRVLRGTALIILVLAAARAVSIYASASWEMPPIALHSSAFCTFWSESWWRLLPSLSSSPTGRRLSFRSAFSRSFWVCLCRCP